MQLVGHWIQSRVAGWARETQLCAGIGTALVVAGVAAWLVRTAFPAVPDLSGLAAVGLLYLAMAGVGNATESSAACESVPASRK